MENNKLDIKDFLLKSNINDSDRILMTNSTYGHYAAAMTIRTFREQVLEPLIGETKNGMELVLLQSMEQYNAIIQKNEKTMYVILGGGKIRQVFIGRYLFATGVGSLGGMDNVVEEIDEPNDSDETLVLMQRPGEKEWTKGVMTSGGGGGGGNTGASIRLTSLMMGNSVTTIPGKEVVLEFNYVSEYYDDQTDTGPGTARVTVNGMVVSTQSVPQGDNHINVTSWLTDGVNTVNIRVTNSLGSFRALTYTVNVMNMSISSTFDASLPVTDGTFSFRYTPVGSLQKTVYFLIDGMLEASYDTNVSNRQLTQSLPNKGHGSHILEVYMKTTVDEVSIESNHLFYDLICVSQGNSTPIIASAFNQITADQYSTIVIPYCVYDPTSAETDITLEVNGTTVSTLRVDSTPKWWSYKLNTVGIIKMSIVCKGVKKIFELEITQSSIDVEAEKNDLELYLSSMGRSNNETNREEWSFTHGQKTVGAQLTAFNWATNGWLTDDSGNVALKLSGDARVHIPLKVFEKDIRLLGKTIEIEFATSEVTDYEAVIASCLDNGKGFKITAQEAVFSGDTTTINSRFKEEERIRISFVIDERSQHRLMYSYINGINSGTKQYAENESFAQVNPQGITLGSNKCILYVYNIRVYDNNLNQFQILNNYIADMDDLNRKIELYGRNQIFNEAGEITYNKVCDFIPCMTITGALPQYKGDKKTVEVTYEDRINPVKSFQATNCQIDVQGTSSQYYPRKNYKTKFRGGFTMTETGEHVSGYKLNENSIPATVFCEKADFAESSGTHNTGLANLINDTLKELGYLTPPQVDDSKVRTTVEGFPIVIFHKEKANDQPVFLGKYNFNTDKAAEETFGFTDPSKTRCIEFRNNTSPRVLFKESEFTRMDEKNKTPEWMDDFEYRYPDSDEFLAGFENDPVPHDFKRLCDWIVACKGNDRKFKEEAHLYFNIPNLLSYFCLTELLGMVDQRAKNMFFTTWDGLIWYLIFYDNDTCLGINNEGEIVFNYDIETRPGNENVWNAYESELWKNVQLAFKDDIGELYRRLRTEDILSYEKVYNYMNKNQSDKWCEAIYNADSKFKYIDPMIEGYWDYGKGGYTYTGEYLYALQGSRADHRKWWLYNRFRYMDSKYNTGQYFGDTATMRLYTPATWAGIAPNADFTLTPYADQYLRVRFGSVDRGGEEPAKKDVPTLIIAPDNITFNDTETIIYGASLLKSVGDLSAKYPGTVDMSSASRLEELIIGSSVPGYINQNLKNVVVKSNKLLRRINIENCPLFTDSLNLSGCESIEEIYARGSGISSVVLPAGGNLRIMQLPSSIRNLRITNQQKLTDAGFSVDGVNNLMTLVLENVGFDVFEFLNLCLKAEPKALERVRLIDIKGTAPNSRVLSQMSNMGGIDAAGNDIDKPICTGDVNIRIMYSNDLTVFNQLFPELKITYEKLAVYFRDKLVEQKLVSKYDTNGDGYLEMSEIRMVTYMDKSVMSYTDVVNFDEFEQFENVEIIYENSFRDCKKLESIKLPPKLHTIGQSAFENCFSLKEITIPDSVRVIHGIPFQNCVLLKEFVARNITSRLDYICSMCTSLKRAVITGPYTIVGKNSFQECSELEEVILSDTVTAFEGRVFFRTGLRSFTLPPLLEKMEWDTFFECKKLESVTIPATIKSIGGATFYGCIELKEVIIHAVIPPSLLRDTFTYANPGVIVYVPDESVNVYKTAEGWSQYASKIRPLSQRQS